jgi:hypothetical protein
VRKPFLVCWKRHTPLVHKICVREILSLFYLISTQRSYINQKLDTNSCFAKLGAISILFSFFLYTLYNCSLLYFALRLVYTCNFYCDFRCDLMDVNEWMNYECSDEGTYSQNNHNSSTHSHTSEEENRARNRSKNCKCKQAFIQKTKYANTKVI